MQAVAQSQSIQWDLICKIATGLCAGISRCGSVSGGVLAISMVTGRNAAKESPGKSHRLVRQFLNECEARFGLRNCEKLVGCRPDTPQGQRFFTDHNVREKCAGFTREAARLPANLLGE